MRPAARRARSRSPAVGDADARTVSPLRRTDRPVPRPRRTGIRPDRDRRPGADAGGDGVAVGAVRLAASAARADRRAEFLVARPAQGTDGDRRPAVRRSAPGYEHRLQLDITAKRCWRTEKLRKCRTRWSTSQ